MIIQTCIRANHKVETAEWESELEQEWVVLGLFSHKIQIWWMEMEYWHQMMAKRTEKRRMAQIKYHESLSVSPLKTPTSWKSKSSPAARSHKQAVILLLIINTT